LIVTGGTAGSDMKEYNDQITDEMIAEIRGAEFVIADFTGDL
jgi:hypothetical protein